jgi:hypothetical protein
MWYCGPDNSMTCYATSHDGIEWQKPLLDVEPGTNIVLKAARDSVTVWFDQEEADPSKRFKLFRAHTTIQEGEKKWQISVHESPDGIHWGDVVAESGPSWDRSTVFWNPFRRVWVFGVRGHERSRGTNFRVRLYKEAADVAAAGRWRMSSDALADGAWSYGEPVTWVGADRLDPHHATAAYSGIEPELYNLVAVWASRSATNSS